MATAMDHVQVLVDRIGPRPVSTEEENQAAQYAAQELIDLGLDVDIDEFATPTGTQWPYTVAFIVSIVGIVVSGLASIFTTMSTTLLVLGLLLAAAGWFFYYSERSGHSLLGRMRMNGVSQNVVARYLPESASREKRRRRIVLVAHIDTTRAQLSASPGVVKHVPLLKKVVNWVMPALVLVALLRVLPLPWPPVVNTVLWVVGVVGCLLLLLDVVDITTHRFMPFVSGANDNATGLAVMLAAARRVLDPAERARREAEKQEKGEGADAAALGESGADADGGTAPQSADAKGGNPFGEAPEMEPMAVHTPQEAYAAGVVPEGATLEYADGVQPAGDAGAGGDAGAADPGKTVVMAGGAQAGAAVDVVEQDAEQAAEEESEHAGGVAGSGAAPSFAERAARAQARKNEGRAHSSAAASKKKSNLPSWYTAGKKKAAKEEDAAMDEAAERERVRSRFADVPTADEAEEDDATAQAEQQVAQFVAAAQASEAAGVAEDLGAAGQLAALAGSEQADSEAGQAGQAEKAGQAGQAPAASEGREASVQQSDADAAAGVAAADAAADAASETMQMSLVGADAAQAEADAGEAGDGGDAEAAQDARAFKSTAGAQTAEKAADGHAGSEDRDVSRIEEAFADKTQAMDMSALVDAAEGEGSGDGDADEAAVDAAVEEVSPADKTMVISAKALADADGAADEALEEDDLDISDEEEGADGPDEQEDGKAEADGPDEKAANEGDVPAGARAQAADADAESAKGEAAEKDAAHDDDAGEPDGDAEEPDDDAEEPAAADGAEAADEEEDAADSRERLFKGLSSLIPSIGSSSQTGDSRQPKERNARQEMAPKPKRQLRSQADKRKPSRRKVDESFIPTAAPKDDERQAAALSKSRQAAAVDSSYEDTPQSGPGAYEDEGFEQSLPPALSGRLPVVGAAADDAVGAASRTSFPTLTGSFPAIKAGAESIDESDFARPSDTFGKAQGAKPDADGDAADDLFAPQGDAADFTIEDSRFHNAVDGVTSIFGRIGKRRKKKKDRDDDMLFGGGDDGWGGDDEWKGGAYFSDDDLGFDDIAELGATSAPAGSGIGAAAISAARKRAAEIRESVIQMTVNDTVDKEIWFVALGASAAGNHGMKNFLELHAADLRGALIVNLEAVGAGDLRYLSTEGEGSVHRSDRRLQTLVRQAAQNVFGHEARAQKMEWRDTDATPALVAGMRAITLMGIDEVAPVGWRWTTDTVDIVDEEQLEDVTDLVLDVIDNV